MHDTGNDGRDRVDLRNHVRDDPASGDFGFSPGARFVFVGRPGISKTIEPLVAEIHRDMALLGLSSVADIDEDCLVSRGRVDRSG